MKEDRGSKLAAIPTTQTQYSVSHYHSDLNSIFTVCFSPEGSIHQRRQTNNTLVLALSHENQHASFLAFLSDQPQSPPSPPHTKKRRKKHLVKTSTEAIDCMSQLTVFYLKIWRGTSASSRFISVSLSQQGATQSAPHGCCQISQNRLCSLTFVFFLSLVSWKKLIWLTFTSFSFFFFLPWTSQSLDSERLFCSVSVLTDSQLALDMSMSSLLGSC